MINKINIAALLFFVSLYCCCDQQHNLERRTEKIVKRYQHLMQVEAVRKNLAEAVQGNPQGEWQMGSLMLLTWTYTGDEEARQLGNAWLLQAVEDGDPYAMLDFVTHLNGVDELPEEKKEELARKGAELLKNKKEKDAYDARYLSCCYVSGIGVDSDVRVAYKWYVTFLEKEKEIPEEQKQALADEWRKRYNVPPDVED